MKRIIIMLLCAVLLFSCAATCASAIGAGAGVAVIAEEVSLIKTGLLGKKLTFSDTDFKSALGVADFDTVTITEIPSSKDGALMLGGRRVGEGQVIRRRNLSSLAFIPATATVSESGFKFTVDNLAAGAEIKCIMKFIDKVNYAPKIDTDAAKTLSVTTQKGISVYGTLAATDPEDDSLDFIIVSYPKYGTLALEDSTSGAFKYTPDESYSGKDSFVYVARDAYGNYSKTASVSLKITERMSEVVYEDMSDSRSYNAALAMTAMGIMNGRRIGDGMYFMPNEGVTRAEFVAMAMKALGIRQDSTLTSTFFDDNDEIPEPLLGYVATAQKCGFVNGSFDGKELKFRPNDTITRYEAAIILTNLYARDYDEEISVSLSDITDVPVWARNQVEIMCSLGIFDVNDDTVGAKEPLTREDVAEYLYRLMIK